MWETHTGLKIIYSPICNCLIAGVPFPLSYAAANFKLCILTVSLILPVLLLFTSRLCFSFPEYQIIYKITIHRDCKKNLNSSRERQWPRPANYKRDAALLCVSPTECTVLSWNEEESIVSVSENLYFWPFCIKMDSYNNTSFIYFWYVWRLRSRKKLSILVLLRPPMNIGTPSGVP